MATRTVVYDSNVIVFTPAKPNLVSCAIYGIFQVVRGKTNNATRDLPMRARVRAIFKRRWQDAGKPSEGWIFPAPTKSKHLEPSGLKKNHIKALEASKIRKFVLYDLRHTSLTRLACECREPWTVARIAGHGGIQIGQTYVHSQRMENSAWWAEWWAYMSAARQPKRDLNHVPALGTNLDTNRNDDARVVVQ